MASRYIPPALRAKLVVQSASVSDATAAASGDPETHATSDNTVNTHAAPSTPEPLRRLSDLKNTLPEVDEGLRSQFEIASHFWPDGGREFDGKGTTLHDSAEVPRKLAWTLLFPGANPRWESDQIVFVKSNLDLLEQGCAVGEQERSEQEVALDEARSVAEVSSQSSQSAAEPARSSPMPSKATTTSLDDQSHKPIAIFKASKHKRTHEGSDTGHSTMDDRIFRFIGWYGIKNLQFLEPQSAELARMLEQKWVATNKVTGETRQRERSASSWQSSLSKRWAVVQFELEDGSKGTEDGAVQHDEVKGDQDQKAADAGLTRPPPDVKMLETMYVKPPRPPAGSRLRQDRGDRDPRIAADSCASAGSWRRS